ncbi:MAG: ribonucleotide-diphosphate reductase subunit alpha [Parcubacteria group bacterium Gr01-1014_18]|nr:MAG: ribonucleotide-diphosphate reductase subunit alpha [Parcubacteria group bacterium Greene0416_36]TSC81265.1 MAG: ribonucleotide-diphosphate reductase subunit alpha [Parcubacteria group bacterium Gr01-1014_18]TSC99287.1 MAG: ribonucleotide-diphosphate reductase subunit alpha [Parcubacteria group bacterium Greene1014_20]TSD06876.1 MAG: ribonucleotide-diphosphate reductase subunit alpha [Parcubacteria group bacterium Greene0714_2]
MDIFVTKRDGGREPFNANRINQSIERVCFGLADPVGKVVQVGTDTRFMLYDGITTEELDQATINAALQNVPQDPEYEKIATRLLLKTLYKRILGDYETGEILLIKHREGFGRYIRFGVEAKILDARMVALFDLNKLSALMDMSRDDILTYAGLSTLEDRYMIKDKKLDSLELPQYFWMRVAMGLSYHEKNPVEAAIRFYDRMSRLEYVAGGSTNIGAGTTRPALSNCFLLEIHDDVEHIAKSVSDILKLSKASGGIGASITKLRASGSPLSSNNTTSSGPTPFAKIIDTAIRAIQRGGKKTGALCFYMENWHIDFPEYLTWKHNAGDDYMRMRTANTSVFLSDEFMKRVENREDWYMFDPKDTPDLNELYGEEFSNRYVEYVKMAEEGKLRVFKKMPAEEQFRQILVSLETTSHPWLTWKDTINLRALNNNTGTIHMSNLCTEICLPQNRDSIAVCNLASLNLATHLNPDGRDMDWKKLAETVHLAIRHLDNLIDINELPVPEAIKSDRENRAVGLGVMGLADVVEKLGFAYDSDEAYVFTDRVFEWISFHAIEESAALAQSRGSYTHFHGSGWSRGMVPVDTFANLEKQSRRAVKIDKGGTHAALDWKSLREKVRAGMRNATLLAVAPNANIGLVAGTTPGIDPRFAQMFSRSKISGKYLEINTNLVTDLKKAGIWEQVREKIVETQGDIEKIPEISADIKARYKSAFTVSPYAFIEVAARAQKWVDQALSRNMYLETRDIEEIMDIYMEAWRRGLKTTYYLHMKPRHTAEQSTIKVNKGKEMGKTGFSSVKWGAPSEAERSEGSSPVPEQNKPEPVASAPAPKVCPVDPQLRLQCDSCQ